MIDAILSRTMLKISLVMTTAALVCAPALARAHQAAFHLRSGYELLLKIDEARQITGEVRTKDNAVAALVEGNNFLPGQIRLHFTARRGDRKLAGTFTYKYRPCGLHSVISLYKKPDCGEVWISEQAPIQFARLFYCDDRCKMFKQDEETIFFDNFVNWSEGGAALVGTLHVSDDNSEKLYIKCLKNKKIKAHFSGTYNLEVPPGLEEIARDEIARCALGEFGYSRPEAGSPLIPLTFLADTFFEGPLNLSNVADKVNKVRAKLKEGFAAEGLEAEVQQAQIGGMDFIITLTGHSDRFPFPGGHWFQARVEFKLTEREEDRVPKGKVQQGQLHVIGTEIFHGPSWWRPAQKQFQPIALVDRSLRDAQVDSILAIEIANRLASRYRGAIVMAPEGF
jgi:hypothetical protein